ncbi:MAG: hypothetical protein ACREM3_05545 [Candidatus Rokuibacteriota bacterium]
MDPAARRRPTTVTVIGWAFIVSGALALMAAVMGLAAWRAVPEPRSALFLQPPPDAPLPLVWASTLLDVFEGLAIAQGAAAAVAMIAGAQFLRLRRWTRPVLETLAWFALVFIVGFGLVWVSTWISVTTGMPDTTAVPPRIFTIMGAMMGIGTAVV